MKKTFIALLFVFCILSFAVAEDVLFTKPITGLSLDELLAMKYQIDLEILTRFERLDGIQIEPGLYIVGEDIPAGNYYFEGVKGRFSSSLYVYPSIEKMGSFKQTQEIHGIGDTTPKSGKVILQDGNAIEFVQGPVIIHPYMGLMN